jgi:hypothetical protein
MHLMLIVVPVVLGNSRMLAKPEAELNHPTVPLSYFGRVNCVFAKVVACIIIIGMNAVENSPKVGYRYTMKVMYVLILINFVRLIRCNCNDNPAARQSKITT